MTRTVTITLATVATTFCKDMLHILETCPCCRSVTWEHHLVTLTLLLFFSLKYKRPKKETKSDQSPLNRFFNKTAKNGALTLKKNQPCLTLKVPIYETFSMKSSAARCASTWVTKFRFVLNHYYPPLDRGGGPSVCHIVVCCHPKHDTDQRA